MDDAPTGTPVAPEEEDVEQEGMRALAVLLGELPELEPIVCDLADVLGEVPSAQCVFAELAGITSHLFGGGLDDEDEERLERIFAAVEAVATASGVDTTETVAFSFLDGLDPGALARAQAYLGPATEHILDQLLDDVLELG